VVRRLGAAFPGAPRPEVAPWEEVGTRAGRADVVVNATSLGLSGKGTLPPIRWHRDQIGADFVYGDTAFSREARAAGAAVVTGESILARQGALAFTLWTGRPAPEAVMAAALGRAPHAP
jgi:shikimate dehydrogenase